LSKTQLRECTLKLAEIEEINKRNCKKAVELVRHISESLVWSEQNNSDFFSYFVKFDVLSDFKRLLISDFEKSLKAQLIQSANILLHNLKNQSSLDYLLKSEFYELIVSYPYDFEKEELSNDFCSLLKGIVTNLSREKLLEYLKRNHYSLLDRALAFFDHKDKMLRTVCRSVIITLFQISDQHLQNFLVNCGVFLEVVACVRNQVFKFNNKFLKYKQLPVLESKLFDLTESIYYLNDILEIKECSEYVSNLFLKELVLPVLVGSLGSEKCLNCHIRIHIAAFLLAQIFQVVKHTPFLDALAMSVYLHITTPELLQASLSPLNSEANVLKNSAQLIEFLEYPEQSALEVVDNPVSGVMSSYLRSRDESLITLNLHIIQSIALNESISEIVLLRCKLKTPFQKEIYNQELVEIIIQLLNKEPCLRYSTMKLLLKLLVFFVKKNLLEEHRVFLVECYLHRIKNLTKYLEKDYLEDKFLEFFSQELKLSAQIQLDQKLRCEYHFVLPLIEEEHSSIALEKRPPLGDSESLHLEIKVFFLMRKCLLLLVPSSVPESLDLDEQPLESAYLLQKLQEEATLLANFRTHL